MRSVCVIPYCWEMKVVEETKLFSEIEKGLKVEEIRVHGLKKEDEDKLQGNYRGPGSETKVRPFRRINVLARRIWPILTAPIIISSFCPPSLPPCRRSSHSYRHYHATATVTRVAVIAFSSSSSSFLRCRRRDASSSSLSSKRRGEKGRATTRCRKAKEESACGKKKKRNQGKNVRAEQNGVRSGAATQA
ncbi:hypothetical protein PIB30_012231 [Stylosanthes scabra]|uniref:Uncharacterized protein n=1 Tax=Stylosanthes scabra TaxID=79078 RepID=A0ABU6V5J8_9FABA|nr:hypothetical protein [Stylosanthes scabra]